MGHGAGEAAPEIPTRIGRTGEREEGGAHSRERFRQEFHRHPEPERRILGDEAGQDLNLLPNLLEFLERRR